MSLTETEKHRAIVRHSWLQRSTLRDGQPTLRNARTLTQNDNSETDESDNDEYDSDAIDSGGEDDSSDVIVAFINFEDANERPNATRSRRTITRRSEIDFSFF